MVETGTVKEVFSHPKTTIAQNFVSTVIQTELSTSLIRRLNDEQVGDFKDYKIFVEETQVTQPIINDLIQICGRGLKFYFHLCQKYKVTPYVICGFDLIWINNLMTRQ